MSTAFSTSSRAYRGLPWLRSTTQRIAFSSSGPSSAVSTSVRTASSLSRTSGRRCASASFQSDTIASGHGSPTRTVATTKTSALVARCNTRVAETGSRSCASSTPSTTARPRARSCTASALPRSKASGSSARAPSGSKPAKAPSGIVRAHVVACTHRLMAPSCSAAASASRPSRVLPAPAVALITTPQQPRSAASAMRASSSSRPTSGHIVATALISPPGREPWMNSTEAVAPRTHLSRRQRAAFYVVAARKTPDPSDENMAVSSPERAPVLRVDFIAGRAARRRGRSRPRPATRW